MWWSHFPIWHLQIAFLSQAKVCSTHVPRCEFLVSSFVFKREPGQAFCSRGLAHKALYSWVHHGSRCSRKQGQIPILKAFDLVVSGTKPLKYCEKECPDWKTVTGIVVRFARWKARWKVTAIPQALGKTDITVKTSSLGRVASPTPLPSVRTFWPLSLS